jgi:hypothetical protein
MNSSVIVDSLYDQRRRVVLRAVEDTVSAALGSTVDAVAAAVEMASRGLDSARGDDADRSDNYPVPARVPYRVSDMPLLPAAARRTMGSDEIAGIVASIAADEKLTAYEALAVRRRLSAVAAPGDVMRMAEHAEAAEFGFGSMRGRNRRAVGDNDISRFPSAAYFGMHVAQRVAAGWGAYDLHIMQGVAATGDRLITFSFGTAPTASVGVQKLVARLVMWMLTNKGSDLVDAEYGSRLLTGIAGLDVERASLRVSHVLSETLDEWASEANDSLPPEERLAGLELTAVAISNGSVVARIKVTTGAGAETPVVLPLLRPEVAYGR